MKSVFQTLFKFKGYPSAESAEVREQDSSLEQKAGNVALQGDMAAIPIDDIFQMIDHAGLTGELEVVSAANSGCFYFDKGMLVFGMLDTNQKKIGELLLAEQQITLEELEECLVIHREGGRQQRLGHILIQKGYILPDNLTSSLNRQVKEAFFDVLSWREGTFLFYIDQLPDEEQLLINERVDHLLLEGMVHIDHSNS